ncbi:DUF221-domain-containing protein [Neocallimastix lanati (nom. inval.)]|jgi:hypothetical protein|nr:DUF221-domain-containing protein [Neocallimastix sp. JGI-2020a]
MSSVNNTTTSETADGTLYSVLYQFLLAFAIVGGFMVGYELLRQSRFGKYIYSPRLLLLPDQTPEVANGWFGWFNKNKKVNEDYILKNNGLDSVMVLKLYRMGYEMFLIIGLFVLVFTLPINILYRDHDLVHSVSQSNTTESEVNNTNRDISSFTNENNTKLLLDQADNSLGKKILDSFFTKREYQIDINELNINMEEQRNVFLNEIKNNKFEEDSKVLNSTDIDSLNSNNTNAFNSTNTNGFNSTNINDPLGNNTTIEESKSENSTIIEDVSKVTEQAVQELKKFDIQKYIFFDTMQKGRENFAIFHVVAFYFVVGFICYKLFKLYQEYLVAIEMYVKDGGIVQERNLIGEILQHSTIMVRNIPPELQDDERLTNWFSKLGIGKIESIVIARSRNRIGKLIDERTKVLNNLESDYIIWLNNIKEKKSGEGFLGKLLKSIVDNREDDIGEKVFEENDAYRPKHIVFKYGIIPVQYVDSIHYNEQKLLDLTLQIKELRLEARDSKKWSQTAFVTFSNHQSAKIAAQLILYSSENPNVMAAGTAPHPNDLFYKNLNIRTEAKTYRSLFIYVAMYFTCFVLFIIVSATKYDTLKNLTNYYFPYLHMDKVFRRIDSSPQLTALFDNFFQVILLNAYTSFVPYILKFLSNLQGFETKSAYANSVLKKYYIFLFVTIILAMSLSTLVGQVFDEKNEKIEMDKITYSLVDKYMNVNFNEFVKSLTTELAKNSVMYLNYGILRLQSFGFEIFRIGAVVSFFIGKLLKKDSPRAQHVAKLTATPPDYSIMLAVPLLCFTIFITFSVVNPFIPFIGVIFFYLGYHIMKNQFIYVYIKDYESQGHYFITAFNRIIFSLFLFEIFMFGYFLAIFKGTDDQTFLKYLPSKIIPYFILPSLIITYYFYNYCRKCFKPRIDNVPVDLLISKERERKYSNHFQRRTIFGRSESFISEYYSEDSFMSCVTHVTTLDNKPNREILKISETQAPDLPPYYEAKSYNNPALTEPLYSPWIPEESEDILTEAAIDNIVNVCKVCYKCDKESRYD